VGILYDIAAKFDGFPVDFAGLTVDSEGQTKASQPAAEKATPQRRRDETLGDMIDSYEAWKKIAAMAKESLSDLAYRAVKQTVDHAEEVLARQLRRRGSDPGRTDSKFLCHKGRFYVSVAEYRGDGVKVMSHDLVEVGDLPII
jgi:hypothetical protein